MVTELNRESAHTGRNLQVMLLLTCSRALVGSWLYRFPRSTPDTHGSSSSTSNVTVGLRQTSHTLP